MMNRTLITIIVESLRSRPSNSREAECRSEASFTLAPTVRGPFDVHTCDEQNSK